MILKGGVTVEIQNHDCTRPQRPQTLRSVHIGQKIFSRKTSVVFKTLIGKRNEMSDIRLGPRCSTEKPPKFGKTDFIHGSIKGPHTGWREDIPNLSR